MSSNYYPQEMDYVNEISHEEDSVIMSPYDSECREPPLLQRRRSPERKHFYSWTVSNRHSLKRAEELLLAPLNYYQAMISQINTISNVDITPFADQPLQENNLNSPLSSLSNESNVSSNSSTMSSTSSESASSYGCANCSCMSNMCPISYDNNAHYYHDVVNGANNVTESDCCETCELDNISFSTSCCCNSSSGSSNGGGGGSGGVNSSCVTSSLGCEYKNNYNGCNNNISVPTSHANKIDARVHVANPLNASMEIEDKDILILIHGFGGGLGYWAQNWTFLSERYELYAIDLPCFGRSNRSKIHFHTHVQVVNYLTSELFRWFNTLQFTKRVIVLGHSFGAYIAAHFTMRYGPTYVKILAMIEPWGINEISPTFVRNVPLHWKVLMRLVGSIGPLTLLRSAGPIGPQLLRHFRPDFKKSWCNYADGAGGKLIYDYIYQCNVCKKVCGDKLIKRCCNHYINAKEPLCNLLPVKLTKDIAIVMVFGEDSWIDSRQATSMASKMRKSGFCVIHKALKHAGHQVFTDNPQEFNITIDKLLIRALRHLWKREQRYQSCYCCNYAPLPTY